VRGTKEVVDVDRRFRDGEASAPPGRAPVLDPDEAPLIRRARDGDLGAFEALYRASVGKVHAVALRMTGDPPLAEEITQDAFVRAWERLGDFEGRSRFGTWVYRMAVNRAIDALRTRKRSPFTSLDDEDVGELPAPRRPEKDPDLENAIAALPAGARAVFVLHDVEGFRHEEIAAMTGAAVGTSKAQLHRARRLLRARLR
jgi:RNA polymerase sigma-70 factor (ECF subfamily)